MYANDNLNTMHNMEQMRSGAINGAFDDFCRSLILEKNQLILIVFRRNNSSLAVEIVCDSYFTSRGFFMVIVHLFSRRLSTLKVTCKHNSTDNFQIITKIIAQYPFHLCRWTSILLLLLLTQLCPYNSGDIRSIFWIR